jgi:hypothetical protein
MELADTQKHFDVLRPGSSQLDTESKNAMALADRPSYPSLQADARAREFRNDGIDFVARMNRSRTDDLTTAGAMALTWTL